MSCSSWYILRSDTSWLNWVNIPGCFCIYGIVVGCLWMTGVNAEPNNLAMVRNSKQISKTMLELSDNHQVLSEELNIELLDGRQIMDIVYQQANVYPAQEMDISMSIYNKDNKKRVRNFTIKKRRDESESSTKSLINFYKPANVKGTKLLTHAIDEDDTNQWIYLPALKSIKKILAEQRDGSFMGSDFSYGDIAGRRLDQDSHQLIGHDDKYIFISSVPVDSGEQYDKINYIIERERLVILKVEFYGNNQLLKKLVNTAFSRYGNMFVASHSVMSNLVSGGKSEILVNHVNIDAQINTEELDIKSLY